MEFTDDLYKRILVDEQGKLTNAHIEAVNNKSVSGKLQWIDFKQIELGYQCFRRKYPEFPENSFRRFCWVKGTVGMPNTAIEHTKDMFKSLGWKEFSDTELVINYK